MKNYVYTVTSSDVGLFEVCGSAKLACEEAIAHLAHIEGLADILICHVQNGRVTFKDATVRLGRRILCEDGHVTFQCDDDERDVTVEVLVTKWSPK